MDKQLENKMISNDRFIDAIISTKLDDNKSLIDFTSYKGDYLWWFVDHDFRCFSGKILGELNTYLRFSEILLGAYAKVNFLLDLTKHLLSRAIVKLCQKNLQKNRKRKKAIFTAQNVNWKTIIDYEKLKSRKTDLFYDSIISQLESTHEIVGVHPLGQNLGGGIRVLIDKMLNWDVRHNPYELFWSPGIWNEERRASTHFRSTWKTLYDDKTLKRLCQYQEKDLYNTLFHRLRFYFSSVFPMLVKYIEMGKKMIEAEKPDLILLQNEYGSFEHALVIAGKLKNVPTVAIQHGIIIPVTHFGLYMFNKAFKDQMTLPDKTCVYGSYYQDLLVNKSIYDSNQVVVTGSPRYDMLFSLHEFASRKEILIKFVVNPKHQIVLWTTSCHVYTWEENTRNIEAMNSAFRDLQEVTLIIKQHPGEGTKYTGLLKENLSTTDSADILLVPKDANTYELLLTCDLLVTKTSTTALEAIALNKPVIVLDLMEKEPSIEYVREGVAATAHSKNDLKKTIRQLLADDTVLELHRSEYIKTRLYQIDGNATRRVVDLVIRLSRDSRPSHQ